MSFRTVFIAIVLGTALLVAAFMLNHYRPRIVTEQPTAWFNAGPPHGTPHCATPFAPWPESPGRPARHAVGNFAVNLLHLAAVATSAPHCGGLDQPPAQQVIDYLRGENQILKEKLGKRRILLNDDQPRPARSYAA